MIGQWRYSGLVPEMWNLRFLMRRHDWVPTDIEVFRAANQLVKQHGDAARLVAAQRADEMQGKRDLDGKRVWVRILKAVEWMLDGTPTQLH